MPKPKKCAYDIPRVHYRYIHENQNLKCHWTVGYVIFGKGTFKVHFVRYIIGTLYGHNVGTFYEVHFRYIHEKTKSQM